MIRQTYKGRKIVITRNKGYGGGWQTRVNGVVCWNQALSESDELAWAKRTIDAVEDAPKGEARYEAAWYAPGTFEVNDNGHVVEIGGTCSCGYCAPQVLADADEAPSVAGVDKETDDSVGTRERTMTARNTRKKTHIVAPDVWLVPTVQRDEDGRFVARVPLVAEDGRPLVMLLNPEEIKDMMARMQDTLHALEDYNSFRAVHPDYPRSRVIGGE